MPKKFSYDFPRPMVTVDCVLLRVNERRLELLLVQRAKPPCEGSWALPGGFIGMDESLRDSALRELKEETGLGAPDFLIQLGAYGDPGRDPRGRTISVAFLGIVAGNGKKPKGGDDAIRAEWHPAENLPDRLAFDHADIIGDALLRLGGTGRMEISLRHFLPKVFTQDDVRSVLMAVFGFSVAPESYIQAMRESGQLKQISKGKLPKFQLVRGG